jgi:anti-sigma regulatory factor (Ser/Thr protein kinase)
MNASAEQRRPTTPDPPTTVEHVFMLLHTPEAVRSMRHCARTILEAEDLPEDTVDDALLVISELTTNALRHALPPAYLRLSVPVADGCRTVRIEVTDSGLARRPHLSSGHKAPEEHGRGLGIVSALSTRYGGRAHRSWSVRWAELTAPLGAVPSF